MSSIIKCPANILEINRIERVTGRIIFLMSSIKTIKDKRIKGVPIGTKWDNTSVKNVIRPQRIIDNQITKAKGNTTTKWTVGVKLNKDKEIVFTKIIINRLIVKMMFIGDEFFNKTMCSLNNLFRMVLFIILLWELK